jgi:hypothetical protein
MQEKINKSTPEVKTPEVKISKEDVKAPVNEVVEAKVDPIAELEGMYDEFNGNEVLSRKDYPQHGITIVVTTSGHKYSYPPKFVPGFDCINTKPPEPPVKKKVSKIG